ncbi:hypothetical protein HOLleu_01205 [Holothuria leucospilota]|uniref:HECT domain-containing protein n=1 Tax=Holothuria leucospilota TaxID=206669 RepID=A0A9Q1CQI2_HOLLE|nr:hypothetical protein HOLleu_01205 [Holothuria leucospilota]
MRTVVQSPLRMLFPSMASIKTMYSNLKPTVKKVCDLLQAEPQNKQEDTALRLLKQYIKSRSDKDLADLLHFLTGSSVLSVSKICVTFTSSSGFGRTPVVHTCGPTLELPSTYTAYREFRSEWDAMLASGYLKMDIA